MLIDCPACTRSYHVSRDEIGPRGRAVVCPRCRAQWFVDGEAPRRDLAATAVSVKVGATETPAPKRRSSLRAARPWIATMAGVAALMALIGLRGEIVRVAPRTARLYALAGLPVNVRGLEFLQVATVRLDATHVAVSGAIRNVAERRVRVPRVVYEVRDAAGADLDRWSERIGTRTLSAGSTLPFATTPHDIPAGAATVVVRFDS